MRRFPFVDGTWSSSETALRARFRKWLSDLDAAYPVTIYRTWHLCQANASLHS